MLARKPIYPTDKAHRKLTQPVQLFILHVVIDNPGIKLREIQDELLNVLWVDINICNIRN